MGLSQSEYVDKILKLFKMQDTKRGFFPIPHDIILSFPQSPRTILELKKMLFHIFPQLDPLFIPCYAQYHMHRML